VPTAAGCLRLVHSVADAVLGRYLFGSVFARRVVITRRPSLTREMLHDPLTRGALIAITGPDLFSLTRLDLAEALTLSVLGRAWVQFISPV
jgi:hypothetical protein